MATIEVNSELLRQAMILGADRDFSRFPKLRTRNPLEGELT